MPRIQPVNETNTPAASAPLLAGVKAQLGVVPAMIALADRVHRGKLSAVQLGIAMRIPQEQAWKFVKVLQQGPEALKESMREAQRGFVRELAAFYDCGEALYSDTIHIVRWREGQSMEAHADNARPDGSPNEYPWRSFASVAYLNDDYEGGEIYFSKLGRSLKPRAGTLVGFTGGLEHFHGVTEVTRGTRYTMPAWHTHDAARRDKAFD